MRTLKKFVFKVHFINKFFLFLKKLRMDQLVEYTKCVNFAAIKHKDQRRKDPSETPYINHPVGINESKKNR